MTSNAFLPTELYIDAAITDKLAVPCVGSHCTDRVEAFEGSGNSSLDCGSYTLGIQLNFMSQTPLPWSIPPHWVQVPYAYRGFVHDLMPSAQQERTLSAEMTSLLVLFTKVVKFQLCVAILQNCGLWYRICVNSFPAIDTFYIEQRSTMINRTSFSWWRSWDTY